MTDEGGCLLLQHPANPTISARESQKIVREYKTQCLMHQLSGGPDRDILPPAAGRSDRGRRVDSRVRLAARRCEVTMRRTVRTAAHQGLFRVS